MGVTHEFHLLIIHVRLCEASPGRIVDMLSLSQVVIYSGRMARVIVTYMWLTHDIGS